MVQNNYIIRGHLIWPQHGQYSGVCETFMEIKSCECCYPIKCTIDTTPDQTLTIPMTQQH